LRAAQGIIALALFSAAGRAEAGPWPTGKGRFYGNLAYEFLSTTELATPDGVTQEIPEYLLHQVGLYGTYGINDRITAVLDRLGFRSSSIEEFESASGIEDLRAGIQLQLGQRGPWNFATRGIVQAPTGDETKGLGILPTGSGAWEGDFRFSAGRSSSGGRVYGYGEGGYQIRGESLRDGFIYEGQLGFWASSRVLLIFNIRGVQPFESEPGDASLASIAGLGDGVAYTALGPSAIVELGESWGVQVEVEDAFNAKNLATGLKLRVKVFWQR
jgi:hypothetical protein